MHTKDILASVLREAGLPLMASRASEEEEAWVSSPDGLAAMQALASKFNKKRA